MRIRKHVKTPAPALGALPAVTMALAAAGVLTSAQAQIQTAGDLLVNIDATGLPAGPITSVPNAGTLGGVFEAVGGGANNPAVAAVFGNGTKGLKFDGNDYFIHLSAPGGSVVNAPAGLVGGNPTSTVEAWVMNPWPDREETVLAWGRRELGDGINKSLNYGWDARWGAIGHWGGADIGFDSSVNADVYAPGTPTPGIWHHLVYTYDGTTTRVYVDGALKNQEAIGLNTHAESPILLGAQMKGDGVSVEPGLRATMTIARVRIHDEALNDAQVLNNYNFEKAGFVNGTGVAPTGLIHRYSFNDAAGPAPNGTVATDSVGGAANNGTIRGTGASNTGGRVSLPGGGSGSAAYIDLPNGMISKRSADNGGSGLVTFEGWFKATGVQNWARIFDFGSSDVADPGLIGGEVPGPGGGGEGLDYLFLSVSEGTRPDLQAISLRNIDGDPDGAGVDNRVGYVGLNADQHYAVTWDEAAGVIKVYANGGEAFTGTLPNVGPGGTDRMSTINDVNVWLGRSNWTGDANTQGEFDEFRVYNAVLSPDQIRNSYLKGPDVGAPVTILAQPTSVNVNSSQPATFSVKVRGEFPISFQWYRGNAIIPGATGSSYTIPSASLSDNGATFKVVVNNSVNGTPTTLTSSTVTLGVSDDTTKPTLVSVSTVQELAVSALFFSEVVESTSATEPFNYTVNGVSPNSVVLLPGGKSVKLIMNDPITSPITVTVSEVTDLFNNKIVENSTIVGERWGTTLEVAAPTPAGDNVALAKGDVDVVAGGADIWGNSDQFQFIYNEMAGDFDVKVKVQRLDRSNRWAKAGLMARFSLDPASQTAQVVTTPRDGGSTVEIETGSRLEPGAGTQDWTDVPGENRPNNDGNFVPGLTRENIWVRMRRNGSTFHALVSKDGINWVEFERQTFASGVPDSLFVGLATTSHNSGQATTAEYRGYSSVTFPGATLAITGQPADATVVQGSRATFTVVAAMTGAPAGELRYQWERETAAGSGQYQAIAGAIAASYQTPFLTVAADDGVHYRVKVSIPGQALVSREALLTVRADIEPPVVVRANGSDSFGQIILTFNEPLGTIGDTFNYSVNPVVTVNSLTLSADGTVVTLFTDPQTPNTVYTVDVGGDITDTSGNNLVPTVVTFRSFAETRGFLNFSVFDGLSTGDNSLDNTLLLDPDYIANNPDFRFYLSAFDTRRVFPTDSREGYGGKISGVFIPPTSGNWIFYLRSDDSSRLFLNTAGPEASGKALIAEEAGCCRGFADVPSAPQALTAGQRYYIETIYKEGTGGDYAQVAAKLDTDPTPPNSLTPIPGVYLGGFADIQGASVAITQQPADQTVILGQGSPTATFTVAATIAGANSNVQLYQWFRDNGSGWAIIPGANSPTYTFGPVLADNGARFRVEVLTPGAEATSQAATLTVSQPNTPPKFTKGANQTVAEDSGPQTVANWATGIQNHSIVRTPIVYGSGFDSLPPGFQVVGGRTDAASIGSGTIGNGVLRLTMAENSGWGAGYTPSVVQTIEAYELTFKAYMGGGTCCGDPLSGNPTSAADGFSVNIANDLPTPAYGNPGEDGAGTGLSVNFDTWDNGGGEAPTIDIEYNTAVLGTTRIFPHLSQGAGPVRFIPVRIVVTADGKATVDYDGTNIYNQIQLPGYAPKSNLRVGFGARTGGANDNHWIDDLSIVAYPPDASSAEAGQTVTFITTVDNPSLFSSQPAISPTGTLTYTPAPNACGSATVTVVAQDNGGTAFGGDDTSDPQTFVITVQCVDDCPVAGSTSLTVDQGSSVTFQLPASDVDGGAVQYNISQAPAHGVVVLQVQSGSGTYTPSSGYSGPDSFNFTVSGVGCAPSAGTVTITVRPTGTAPTARIEITPTVDFSPALPNKVVIAGDGTNGCVRLDGSLSSDAESPNSDLTFLWFVEPSPVPSATGMIVENFCLELGTHTIMLSVTDPTGLTGTAAVTIDVISAGEAIEELINLLDNADIARKTKRPFIASLKAAVASVERGNDNSATGQLSAFQNKVRAQIAKDDPALAAELIRLAQAIIDAINAE